MAQFRKGFIYTNPNASFGEPTFHRYVDKRQSYTGFMPIATNSNQEDFYIVRTIGKFEDEILYHYNKDGELLSQNQLGAKIMTYRAELNADGSLYFDNNHRMEHYDPNKAQFIPMDDDKPTKDTYVQIITCANLRADFRKGRGNIEIWNTESELLIINLKNEFTVHNVNCAFSARSLIVHTDYGIVRIYKMN